MTGKSGKKWDLRYLHWPEDGTDPLPGTANWTPDDDSPVLWYSGARDPSQTVESGGGPNTPPADALPPADAPPPGDAPDAEPAPE